MTTAREKENCEREKKTEDDDEEREKEDEAITHYLQIIQFVEAKGKEE